MNVEVELPKSLRKLCKKNCKTISKHKLTIWTFNYALEVASRVAPTNLSVLITGESGVGKEVFSQIIHQLSPRKHESFIAVNCGAIPRHHRFGTFGHEKGSFTGAY
ncbi:MAG: sigma 54-interacting transcriptional regulator [Bacteroidetes bacterium]|nr:sigma 54-interacting transcriptional regulator [Bacteroidota bacterium]